MSQVSLSGRSSDWLPSIPKTSNEDHIKWQLSLVYVFGNIELLKWAKQHWAEKTHAKKN